MSDLREEQRLRRQWRLQRLRERQQNPQLPAVAEHQSTPIVPASSSITSRPPIHVSQEHASSSSTSAIPFRPSAGLLSDEDVMSAAIDHLRGSSNVLKSIISATERPAFKCLQPTFLSLVRTIIYDSSDHRADDALYRRFITILRGEDFLNPDMVSRVTEGQFRIINMPLDKKFWLTNLAENYKKGVLSDDIILGKDDDGVFKLLNMYTGLNEHSIRNYMVFSLNRPDVLLKTDDEVRNGVRKVFHLHMIPTPSEVESRCEMFKPYRSLASLYMKRYAASR